jgi:hypothetical protein
MPILQPSDLYTQMYPEVQALITRNDSTIAAKAINSAIADAKCFLDKYDLVQLFGNDSTSPPVAAAIYDEFLNDTIKSIAIWHVLRLANASVDLALARSWYEDAQRNLKQIQQGIRNPKIQGTNQSWPYYNTVGETAPQGDSVFWKSAPRICTNI